MRHTQIANAKKEVIDFYSCFGSGTIISEITKVFDAARKDELRNWDRDESLHYSSIINAVIYFTASLTQLIIESSTVSLRGEAEKRVFGERLEATPDSMDTEKFLSIGSKLLSKFPSTEINNTLWECYFEAMNVKDDYSISRMELSSIGFTLKVVTSVITEMDFLINRVGKEVEVLN